MTSQNTPSPSHAVAPANPAQTPAPAPAPALTNLVVAMLSVFEGCYLNSYRDSGGVWTIGYGHTKGVQANQTITHDEAVKLLLEDISGLIHLVQDKPVCEAAALVDFGYNCGEGWLLAVLSGKASVADPRHTHDRHGNVLPGLVKRRNFEIAMIEAARER